MYHIALTVSQNGDGTWTVCAYKQDAKSGATLKATTFTAPSGWSLANFVQTHAYLGRAFDGDNTKDADATYDEVRIWNGVLTEAQLSANAVAGPDAPFGGEVKPDTAVVSGITLRVGADGATIDTNGKDVTMHAPVSSLTDGLVHRWSFNGDLKDSVGDSEATMFDGEYVQMGDGQAVKFKGEGDSYADLGAYVLPTNGPGATIEIWATLNAGNPSWARIVDIGTSGSHSAMICWNGTMDYLIVRNGRSSGGSTIQTLSNGQLGALTVGKEYHIAVTFSQVPAGAWIVQAFKRDIATGAVDMKTMSLVPPSGWTLEKLIQTNCYIGRGFDTTRAAVSYDEVRIYNRALSEAELMASAAAGPDADLSAGTLVKTGLGTLTLCGTNTLACPLRVETGVVRTAIDGALSTNSVVELCAGTLLDLGGRSVVAGGLTGGGAAVSNGTLSVTRTICPTGEIVLDGVDVRGTLEVTSGSGTLRRVNGVLDLSGIDLDVKSTSPAGQTVIECTAGFTGDFATVVMPANRRLARSATTVRVVRPGLIIIVK